MIKPTKLIIKNIGKIADAEIPINKPLILFYGEIKNGKSTILNCVRWVCGGEFPTDIIRHGADDGAIELHFDGGMISRSFYRAKDKAVKARPVIFVRGGKAVASPVAEIKRLLNPFLLDQDFLRNKTELERKQYFAEMFAVDTTALDMELFNSQRDAQNLRSKIDGYGKIELVPVEPVDASNLQSELSDIRNKFENERQAVIEKNNGVQHHNNLHERRKEKRETLADEIESLKKELAEKTAAFQVEINWLNTFPRMAFNPEPNAPDTSALEKQIQDAGATNVRAEQFQKDKKRAADKEADEKKLSEMTKRQRDIKAEKQAKLKEVSATCGVPGLEFDEEGNFMYEGTTAGMISDSQLMKLSNALSNLYPDGFDVSLLDRAESLGKSIFEYVERAKEQKKTILATIVGERPAKVPPEVGVFVVENGKVQS
jgi:DNA repair exonuclease SbcCD ATPase subunit